MDLQPNALPEDAETAEAVELVADIGGERLDRWLTSRLGDRSRAEVQRWIDGGRVLVGHRVQKASYRLDAGDVITVSIPPARGLPGAALPEPIPLAILYEDADLLVIDKPAGMVVHPGAGNAGGTLVNAVLHYCPELEGVGGVQRPGIVHRLDRDTSGLILVAKNDRAHRVLQAQFKQREVNKSYLALAYGNVTPTEGQIEAPIGRDERHRKRMAVVSSGRGRTAVTRYRVLHHYGPCTLLECWPLTGRTHQIRVHLAYVGHPIVGDAVYGGRRKPPVPLGRQFLHAHRLRFRLPSTGEEVDFTAPLPPELGEVLDRLSA